MFGLVSPEKEDLHLYSLSWFSNEDKQWEKESRFRKLLTV